MNAVALLIISILILAALGIIIAFSPTLIIAEIAILTRAKNPVIPTVLLITGIAASVALFGLVTLLFLDPANEIAIPSTREVLGTIPIADILVGILLAVGGIKLLRPDPGQQSTNARKLEFSMSSKAVFWFGFIKMSTSLSSLAAIIIASRYIKTYYAGEPIQFAALFWLIAIAVAPFALLVAAKLYRPQLFGKIQSASDRVNKLDWRRLIAGAMLLGSISFLLLGVRSI